MEHQLSDAGEGAIPVRAGLLLASVRVASSRRIVSWGTGSSRSSSMQRASRRVRSRLGHAFILAPASGVPFFSKVASSYFPVVGKSVRG